MARRIDPSELAPAPAQQPRGARRVSPDELAPAGNVPSFEAGPLGGTPRPPSLERGAGFLGDVAVGTGEVGLTMFTGGLAEVIAGLAGIEEFIKGGEDRAERAAGRVERVQNMRTFQPRTEMGQQMLEGLSKPFQALQAGAEKAGQATLDVTGSPLAATAVYTAIQAAPMALGVRGRRSPEQQSEIQRLEKAAADQGINFNAGVPEQRQQIAEAGRQQAPGARGDASPLVQQALIRAREEAARDRDALYEDARRTRAGVPTDEVAQLPDIMQRVTRDFLVEDMPRVKRLLQRLEKVRDLPPGSAVHLRAIDDYRRMLNRNRPSANDPAQRAALGVMKAELDNWLDTMFDANMVSGDPTAIAKWKEARRAHKSYRERFSDNRVIRNLTEMEAEPTQVRNWIFGASLSGAKSEATGVVRRIKSELGEDSPEFTALRQDATLDIIEPMLQPEPNLRQFIRNYDRLVKSRPDLAREILGGNKEGLDQLRSIASAHMNRPISSLSELPGGARILAVAAFGHQLAKGALRRAAGEAAINTLRSATGISAKRRMMGEILGYDPFAPMFKARMPAIGGATQELANPPQEKPSRAESFQIPLSAP